MSTGTADEAGAAPDPPPGILRWDLAVRLVLAVVLPILGHLASPDAVSEAFLATVLAAVLVSFGTFGPEFTRWRLLTLTAVGVPVAVIAGAAASRTGVGGALLVFVLFAAYGAAIRAGMAAQLAWFPVSAAGLLSAVLLAGDVDLWRLLGAACGGSLLAVLLVAGVHRLLPAPRLPLPDGALDVDRTMLDRMVRRPSLQDWGFPLLLGGLAAALLVVAALVTGGFKPYWAVFALVTVLAPSKAQTRHSAGQTVLAAVLGVSLSAVILRSGLDVALQALLIVALGLVGAVIMLRHGLISKILLTPLPVVAAAWALDVDGDLALQFRLIEYLGGAALGLGAAALAEVLVNRLESRRAATAADVVG